MAFDAHKNFAITTVSIPPTPATSGTSLTVQDASVFPAVPFNATVWPLDQNAVASNSEIVRVTGIASNTLTITRTQETSSARTILASDRIAATITAKTVTDMETVLSGTTALPNGQLFFPVTQNPSAGANVLDDYKEGIYTPVIGGSTGTSGQTYGLQFGWYRKMGSLVIAFWDCTFTAKGTINGVVQLQSLPFLVSASAGFISVGAVRWASIATNWVSIIADANGFTQTANIMGANAAAGSNSTNLVTADLNNTSQLSGTIAYIATA